MVFSHYKYLALRRVAHVKTRNTKWLVVMHHVTIPSQWLVVSEAAEVRQVPVLVLCHCVLCTKDDLE